MHNFLDYAYFGNIGTASSPYDQGRTTTHEVGHWLNLRHIWGDSNCGNDFCSDTPEHSGSNYGCPSFPSTSNCSGNGISGDMFMNYMDYTNDACMNLFTNDQKSRMLATLNTSRMSLLTSDGCYNSDYGCTDQNAYNYSALAIFNDGSCCYNAGCTDILSINYDSTACFDNNSCVAPILGCTNPSAANFDSIANTIIAFGGALDNTIGGGSYFNNDQHLNFDASKSCIIKSAIIYSESANTITFELRDNSGSVIDDTTLNVVLGQQRIILNFDVPIGNDMQLGVAAGALQSDGLYRNNSGPSYPYNIASAISITSSSASSAPLGYYYFFYDIEVTIPCVGAVNTSWNCIQGNCIDPGTGQGTFASLLACQANCIVITPSWNCVQGNCIDPGNGQGTYTNLSDCQTNCIAPSWDCVQGNCIDPGNAQGTYTSLSDCQTNCIAPSWDCVQGNCIDPGNGQGTYTSLFDCQINCIAPSWNCVQGNCIDPGNGQGTYTSLFVCQTNCIVPSWDCDNQGNCYDPGTGNGLYSSLNDCELECFNVSIDDFNLAAFKIYPNPSREIFNIQFTSEIIQDLRLRVLNVRGEEVIVENLQQFIGEYVKIINVSKFAKGIYYLNLETNTGVVNKKLILF